MAPIGIRLPARLRDRARANETIAVEADTVGEAIQRLTSSNPELARELMHPNGTLRRSFAVLLNGIDIRNFEREATRVRSGDSISFVPSIAGG